MTVQLPFLWVERHLCGAAKKGVDTHQFLTTAMIDDASAAQGAYVSAAQWLLLCMKTNEILNDAAHGLADMSISSSYASLGLQLALGASTLEASIKALSKFYNSISNAVNVTLDYKMNTAVVTVSVNSLSQNDRIQLEETYLIWIFMHCLYYMDGNFIASSVTTRDPKHFNLGQRHFGIGAILRWDNSTSFAFPKALLAQGGLTRAGKNVFWECESLWLDFIDGKVNRHPQNIANQTRSLAQLAQAAGISTSTMRRRIESRYGSYREMRKWELVAAAEQLLCNTHYSVDAVATELGYHDARAFRRFFANATGQTPSELRAELKSRVNHKELCVRKKLEELGARMAG